MSSKRSLSYWPLWISLLVIAWYGCQKWDLEKVAFLEVKTLEATADSPTSLVIQSEIIGLPAGATIDQYGVAISYTNPEPNLQDDFFIDQGQRSQDGNFQTIIQGLAVEKPLFVRAFASSGGRLAYGATLQASPTEIGFEVRMDSIQVTNTKVKLYGYVKGSSGVVFPGHGFVWSTQREEPDIYQDEVWFIGAVSNEEALMEGELPEPAPLEVYYVRAFVLSGPEVLYSPQVLTLSKGNVWRNLGAFPVTPDESMVLYNFDIDEKQYVAFQDHFGIYDPVSGSWEPKADSNPKEFSYSVISPLEDEAVVRFSTENWKYHAPSDSWNTISNVPLYPDLVNPTGFAIGNTGYFSLGGTGAIFYPETYRYLPATESWEVAANFPGTEVFERGVFEFENKACLVKGFFYPFNDCWCFEEGVGWTQIQDFPITVTPFDRVYSFTIGPRGYLILPDAVENFWEYDSRTDVWTPKADFPGGARLLALAFAQNGRGYFGLGFESFTEKQNFEMWEYIPDPE